MNEQGLFEILEKIQAWHNAKQVGTAYNEKQLQNLRLEIIELAGLDTNKLIDLADEIDGCCFEIAQSENRNIKHLLEENKIIDRCSSNLRALVENI